MKDSKKILILCNFLVVLFLITTSVMFTSLTLMSNSDVSNLNNITTNNKLTKSKYDYSLAINNHLLKYFTNEVLNKLNKCSFPQIKSFNNNNMNNKIMINKNQVSLYNSILESFNNKVDFVSYDYDNGYSSQISNQNNKSIKKKYNFNNNINMGKSSNSIVNTKDISNNANTDKKILEYKDKNIENTVDDFFLYKLSLIIQISFAFGLSGLYTNKKVLKLGIY